MKTKIANLIQPWVMSHASKWPSSHAQHSILLRQIIEARMGLHTIATLPDRTAGSSTTLDEAREIARQLLER